MSELRNRKDDGFMGHLKRSSTTIGYVMVICAFISGTMTFFGWPFPPFVLASEYQKQMSVVQATLQTVVINQLEGQERDALARVQDLDRELARIDNREPLYGVLLGQRNAAQQALDRVQNQLREARSQ